MQRDHESLVGEHETERVGKRRQSRRQDPLTSLRWLHHIAAHYGDKLINFDETFD